MENWEEWKKDNNKVESMPSQKLLILVELGLTPYEMALIMVILKYETIYGRCIRNTRNLSEESNMSEGSVVKAKRGLLEKGLIKLYPYKSETSEHIGHGINTFMTDDELLFKI